MRHRDGCGDERQQRRQERVGRLMDRLSIPADAAPGICSLTAFGQRQICIENYQGILEYTPERLVVLTKQCRVEVGGSRLEISYYGKDEMKVTGKIEEICYRKR